MNKGWRDKLTQSTFATNWQISIQVQGSEAQIVEAIGKCQASAVSDGSFQNQCGACAWIIEGLTSKDHITGSMVTPGALGDHSSFWSKAACQYGLLLTLHFLIEEYGTTMGLLIVTCDGWSVLDRLSSSVEIHDGPQGNKVDGLLDLDDLNKATS